MTKNKDAFSFDIHSADLATLIADNLAKRSTLPVLEHLLFELVNPNTVRVTSTDTLQTLSREFRSLDRSGFGGGKKPLRATAHAGLLKAAINGLDEMLEISLDGPSLIVRGQGERRYSIPSLPAKEWPSDHPSEKIVAVEGLDVIALRDAIRRVRYAAATADYRPQLNGIFISPAMVSATDGLRCALVPTTLPLPTEGVILPIESVKGFLAALEPRDTERADEVKVERLVVSNNATNALRVTNGTETFTTQLVDAVYPDLKGIRWDEASATHRATFTAGEVVHALARLLPFCESGVGGKRTHRVTLDLNETSGARLIAEQGNGAKSVESISAHFQGEGEFLVNPVQLRDALNVAHGAAVTFVIDDESPKAPYQVLPDNSQETHLIVRTY